LVLKLQRMFTDFFHCFSIMLSSVL